MDADSGISVTTIFSSTAGALLGLIISTIVLLLSEKKFRPNITKSVEGLSKAKTVQEIAASQIDLLSNYYNTVLAQSQRSFLFAWIAAGFGLLFFMGSVGFMLYKQDNILSTISLLSGALIEVISGINFYLYNKSIAQMADFHTRLDSTQRFLIADGMCDGLEGTCKQDTRSGLIKTIAGVNTKSSDTKNPPT